METLKVYTFQLLLKLSVCVCAACVCACVPEYVLQCVLHPTLES